MQRMDFTGFSPFVADMIRERWRRVFGDHYPPVDGLEDEAGDSADRP